MQKKNHHFIPRAYIRKWRQNQKLFALDINSLHCFEPTGENSVGAEHKFYSFDFDETVIGLLKYTFNERALTGKPDNIYRMMLAFIEMMKAFDYKEKETNLFEDYFEKLEININKALMTTFRGDVQIINSESSVFDNLVILFFTQQMRTRKMRSKSSEFFGEIYADNVALSQMQKDDYIKIWLLIESLATALKVIDIGCILRLRFASGGEKFVTCDAPVLQTNGRISSIQELSGCIPLSPRYIMELGAIGSGSKMVISGDISNLEVEEINMQLINNAHRHVYFSTKNHRQKYADRIRLNRLRSLT